MTLRSPWSLPRRAEAIYRTTSSSSSSWYKESTGALRINEKFAVSPHWPSQFIVDSGGSEARSTFLSTASCSWTSPPAALRRPPGLRTATISFPMVSRIPEPTFVSRFMRNQQIDSRLDLPPPWLQMLKLVPACCLFLLGCSSMFARSPWQPNWWIPPVILCQRHLSSLPCQRQVSSSLARSSAPVAGPPSGMKICSMKTTLARLPFRLGLGRVMDAIGYLQDS
ncbi:uncharacterized protein [Lolium perenne]|uniref:uncharacterized protein n=1 Tax=Lolium perenne TaxID=4522 RepID=UPI0021F651AA|nr:uncharacterized protein LOC127342289 isoform X3 [Lolium perenne]